MTDDFDPDTIIDARGCILGRVASHVAERALAGDRIAVVNAEAAVITGSKQDVLARYEKRADLGSDRGPYYPKRPDRLLKRAIRGMLPHRRTRGREAYERVRVYTGNPFDADPTIIPGTELDQLSNIRFVQLGVIAEHIGANVTW